MSGNLWQDPDAGMIATLQRGGVRQTLHFPGSRTEALQHIIAACDAHGQKIVALSSPTTIYRDLQGPRTYRHGQRQDAIVGVRSEPVEETAYPEAAILGQLGRSDLFVVPCG